MPLIRRRQGAKYSSKHRMQSQSCFGSGLVRATAT
jgi:hypothetical protein